MRIIGIDPGVSGALALFSGGKLDSIADMPTLDGRTDGIELSSLIEGADYVYLENTHPMPKNGNIASYKLGLNTGIIIGVVETMLIPLVRIPAETWKRAAGLIGKPKDASLGLARELWPHLAKSELRLQKHHNRAEAALIARYGSYSQIHYAQTGEDEHEGDATVSDLRGVDRHPAGLHRGRVDRPAHRTEPSGQSEGA